MTELNAIKSILPLGDSLDVELTYYPNLPPNKITEYLTNLCSSQNTVSHFFLEQKDVLEGIVESSREILLKGFLEFYLFERDPTQSDLDFQKEVQSTIYTFNEIEEEIKDDKSHLEIYNESSDFFQKAKLRLNKLRENGLSNSQINDWRGCFNSLNTMSEYLDDLTILVEDLIDLGEKTQRVEVLSLYY